MDENLDLRALWKLRSDYEHEAWLQMLRETGVAEGIRQFASLHHALGSLMERSEPIFRPGRVEEKRAFQERCARIAQMERARSRGSAS